MWNYFVSTWRKYSSTWITCINIINHDHQCIKHNKGYKKWQWHINARQFSAYLYIFIYLILVKKFTGILKLNSYTFQYEYMYHIQNKESLIQCTIMNTLSTKEIFKYSLILSQQYHMVDCKWPETIAMVEHLQILSCRKFSFFCRFYFRSTYFQPHLNLKFRWQILCVIKTIEGTFELLIARMFTIRLII